MMMDKLNFESQDNI